MGAASSPLIAGLTPPGVHRLLPTALRRHVLPTLARRVATPQKASIFAKSVSIWLMRPVRAGDSHGFGDAGSELIPRREDFGEHLLRLASFRGGVEPSRCHFSLAGMNRRTNFGHQSDNGSKVGGTSFCCSALAAPALYSQFTLPRWMVGPSVGPQGRVDARDYGVEVAMLPDMLRRVLGEP